MPKTLSQIISDHLSHLSPQQTVFIDYDGTKVSAAEFSKLIVIFENFFLSKQISPGQRIGLYFERSVRFVAAIIAVIRTGGVVVPLDFNSVPERALSVFLDAEISFALSDSPKLKELAAEKFPILSVPEVKNASPVLQKNSYIGRPEDPAYLAYTSGTTGRPKGAILSHRAIHGYLTWFASVASSSDRFVMALPFSTTVSFVDTFSVFYTGCTGIVFAEKLLKEPKEFVTHMKKNQTTVLMVTATSLHMLMNYGELSQENVPSLKKVLFGASAYPTDQLRTLRGKLPDVEISHLYGNTETGIICSYTLPQKFTTEDDVFMPVGKLLPHLRARLERNIPDMDFPENEGEMWVSGANILTGYWNRPDQTLKKVVADEDGTVWYRTGDVAQEVTPGCYRLIGRVDRIFKKNGYQVEPEEVERHLSLLSEISNLAVIPQKRASGETLVYAYVIKAPDAELSVIKLKKYCAEKLPSHMVPDRFIFMAEFPKTTSGKIDYIKLAEIKHELES